jgi:hypothetical protein
MAKQEYILESNNCRCYNCRLNAEKYHANQILYAEKAKKVFVSSLKFIKTNLERDSNFNPFTKYAKIRSIERVISLNKLLNSFYKGAIPIWYIKENTGLEKVLILSVVDERPIHSSIHYDELENTVAVVTLYRPDSEKWRWSDDYTLRCYDHVKEGDFKREKQLGNRT